MILSLLVLAFTLSLDNFRVAIALGTLRLSRRRAVQVALTFGLWDGLAPLVGVLLGNYLGQAVGPLADYLGPAALGGYGVYLLVQAAFRAEEPEELDHPWALFGIPLLFSMDNLLAGAGLGLLGFSPFLSAAVFGGMTVLMSFVGLQLGRVGASLFRVRVRLDLLSGVTLIVMAVVLAVAF